MPPQRGHQYLIDTAAEQCERLYVMICSDPTQPIDGKLRFDWLKEMYHGKKNVKILWCQDENPQYPHECISVDVFYRKFWVPSVYKLIPELDAVFTSEDYGDEFAWYLGIQHVLVDQPRSHYAVSATAIRTNPFENWSYIPQMVKPYYTKKVVVLGTESCGKSTLVEKLSKEFGIKYWVEEYGRTYAENKKDDEWMVRDFERIAIEHAALIKRRLRQNAAKYLFIDTEAIITKTFGEMYVGDEFTSKIVDNIIENQNFDLYLLLTPDVPWVNDGTRDFPEDRMRHFDKIKRELDGHGIKYVQISGSYEERFKKAKEEAEKLIYL